MSRTLIMGAILGVILAGIGLTDYLVVERPRMATAGTTESSSSVTEQSSSTAISEASSSETTSATSSSSEKKGVGKQSGPDIEAVLRENNFTVNPVDEKSILEQSSGNAAVKKFVILQDNDRAAFVAWIDTPNVKDIFATMKKSLSESFSGNVKDLVDEPILPPNGPPRDVLAFLDPKLGEERFVFVRVRTRLFEFHVPSGKDELIAGLIEKLAK